uniref:BTB domain-containing protein n=1 Tax=Panagrolaimus sp. ES5 TaxID=591445 RepID=A0AC34GCG4_9BILA
MASQLRPKKESVKEEFEEEVVNPPQRSTLGRNSRPISLDDMDEESSLLPPAKKRREQRPTTLDVSPASPTRKQPTASTHSIASATPNQSLSLQHSKLYESLTDKKYHDVILVASDGTEITTHRCVLAKYSTHFEKLIEESEETPVKISTKYYDAETIQDAVDYICNLQKECCAFVVQRIDVLLASSICEYIKIAYKYNLEELKQKCLKILFEKKKEIDASKWNELPNNILIDVLLY